MKYKIVLLLLTSIFFGCVYTERYYKVEKLSLQHKDNVIYLEEKTPSKNKRLAFHISIHDNKIRLSFGISENIRGSETFVYWEKEGKFSKILGDVYIYNSSGDRIKILNKEIVYPYMKYPEETSGENEIEIPFKEKIKGDIVLELGKIEVSGKVFLIPSIKLGEYQKTSSWGLVETMLMQGNVINKPFYESEKKVRD